MAAFGLKLQIKSVLFTCLGCSNVPLTVSEFPPCRAEMTNPEMEEKLREAACFGDIEGVKELIAR